MFSCFHDAYTKEKSKGLQDNKAAERWYDYINLVENSSPDWASFLEPEKDTFRYKLFVMFTKETHIDNFIMIIIILNLFTMAMSFETSTQLFNDVLDNINLVFVGIFILECFAKILALGPTRYFQGAWNQFDSFVVFASIVDLGVTKSNLGQSSFLKSFQIIRVLRVLRVTR